MSLPRDVVVDYEGWDLNCPWCSVRCAGATVTLEGLLSAHGSGALGHAWRDAEDRAPGQSLRSTCPSCSRPFLVALEPSPLTDDAGSMRLRAVRTDTDVRFLSTSTLAAA